MADISAEITAFKNAVYGEDVRSSMVSLANKVNNESSTALSNVKGIIGDILYNGPHSYHDGPENFYTNITVAEGDVFAIRVLHHTGIPIEAAFVINGAWSITIIEDDKYHFITIPANATGKLVFTYRGSEAVTVDFIVVKISDSSLITDINSLITDINSLNKKVEPLSEASYINIEYPYSGYINTSGQVIANANFFYSDFIDVKLLKKEVKVYWHHLVATFTFYNENKEYINKYIRKLSDGLEEDVISIPPDAVYAIVCTDPTFDNEVYSAINIREYIFGNKKVYGNHGIPNIDFNFSFSNFTVCPCKRVTDAGKVTSLYIKSYTSGTTRIYIGEVDQLYLFVPRTSFEISVRKGIQNIDVSDYNIFINEGEQILYAFIGNVPFMSVTGTPEDDESFYYNTRGGFQLEKFGAEKSVRFGFGYTIESSRVNESDSKIYENSLNINSLQDNVSTLQSNLNILSDRSGNKYKMIVQNGALALLPMNFSHVICVGNSYTTHPTVEDVESDYHNNLWWGHWSMAASTKDIAWTTLLQNVLRQKINNAKVTPVFGRRYETGYNTYTLDNPNTFTYWDETEWKSFKNNLENFSDVDAIIFFLGANYSGNDWYTLYSGMVNQFLTWLPNVSVFCCSCSSSSNTAKDTAIETVANENAATYISMVGIGGKSKIGSYVKADDGILHQINNLAVANHFGDYGEYLILDRICNAIGYQNNVDIYNINISSPSGVTLSVISTKTIEGSVISIFANVDSGVTLSSVTVTDANSNNIAVTDHGSTDYGRIFTFIMPSTDVSITGTTT